MKFTTAILPLLATAVSVSASSQATLVDDGNLSVPGENPLKYCSDPTDYILDIDDVTIDPNPPQAGKKLAINAKGSLSKAVKRGTVAHLTVKYGLIKILERDVSICEEAGNADLQCPLTGKVELKKEVELPAAIPPGQYNVIANVTNEDDEMVTCLQASIPFHLGGVFGSKEDL